MDQLTKTINRINKLPVVFRKIQARNLARKNSVVFNEETMMIELAEPIIEAAPVKKKKKAKKKKAE
tara:strand:+ start:259 stop:456 length:198 start_codon:yes stop_codon:yes gene_type:complete